MRWNDRTIRFRSVAGVETDDIARNLDHDRAWPAILQSAEGPAHRRCRGFRDHDLLDLFGDRGVGAAGSKGGKHLRLVAGMRKRQEQDRDAVGEGRGDSGKGVLGPGTILHHENAGRLAVGNAGEAVGHVNADPLLTADDRADAGGDGILDQRRRWKAEEGRNSLPLEDFNDGICASHSDVPLALAGPDMSVGGAAAKGKSAASQLQGYKRNADCVRQACPREGYRKKSPTRGSPEPNWCRGRCPRFQPAGIGIAEKLSVTALPRPICAGPYG